MFGLAGSGRGGLGQIFWGFLSFFFFFFLYLVGGLSSAMPRNLGGKESYIIRCNYVVRDQLSNSYSGNDHPRYP